MPFLKQLTSIYVYDIIYLSIIIKTAYGGENIGEYGGYRL